ncbi:MAG: hypothetical protein DI589_21900 [Shinella sp.]|nr:MAG: hypothetical protein DI589_21900 [Shinella sp.]
MAQTSISNMQAGTSEPWFLLDLSRAVRPIIWPEREKYEFQTVDMPNGSFDHSSGLHFAFQGLAGWIKSSDRCSPVH